jgi:hypothetical protein
MNINYIKECEKNINNLYNIIYFSNNFIKKKSNNNILISIYENYKIFNIYDNITSKITFKNSINEYIKIILNIKNTLIAGDYVLKKIINNNNKINFFELEICFYNITNIQLKKNIKKIIKILNIKNIKIYENKNNILILTNFDYNIKINLIRYKSIINIIKKKNLFNKFVYDGENIFTNAVGHNLIINKFNNIRINKYDLIKYKHFITKYSLNIPSFEDYIDLRYIYTNKLIDNFNLYKVNNNLKTILDISCNKIVNLNNITFKKRKRKKINIQQLLSILKKDNLKELKIFIKDDINIIYTKIYNLNLIHHVCKYNSVNILKYILDINNNLINEIDNYYNISPLFFCIICRNLDIFKILLNNINLNNNIKWIVGTKKKMVYNIVDLCIILNRQNFIKTIINNNIDIELSSYYKCIECDNFEILKILDIKNINILNEIMDDESLLSKSIKKINKNVEQRKIIVYLIEKGIKLDYKNNIQPLHQIVELNDISLLNFVINSGANVNCLDNDNMNCLDIINKQRNELLKLIYNEQYKINFDIFKNKIIKKYSFLIKELYNNKKYITNDIINLKKKLDKLNEINNLILENDCICNNKINVILNNNNYKILFKNKYKTKQEDLLNLYENIYNKKLVSIRKFMKNNKNILYAEIMLYYTNRSIFHLIIESNLKDILEDFINLIIEQCNNGIYYNSIINKNLNNIYKINYNNKFKNNNSHMIYCYLINQIILLKSNNHNIIQMCIINKSYECLDFFLNNKKTIPEKLVYDSFYNINNLLLTIEYNELGLFILIFDEIKNKINNKDNILFKIIENKSVKILYYINKEYKNFFNLEIKDSDNNNLFHYLFNNEYIDSESIYDVFRYLYKKIPNFLYLINNNDISPLYKLTKTKNINILKMLINLNIDLSEYDYIGYNLIHYSIINNNISFINYFIDIYPDLCSTVTKIENKTPLMICIIKNNLLIFNKLIKINSVKEEDLYGNNIYHYMAIYSRLNFLNENNKNKNNNNHFNISMNDLVFEKLLFSLYTNNNVNDAIKFYNFINPKKEYKLHILNKSNINKLKNKIIYKYYFKDKSNSKYIIKNN